MGCSNILLGNSLDKSDVWESKLCLIIIYAEQTIGQQGVFWKNNCLKNLGLIEFHMLWIISFL